MAGKTELKSGSKNFKKETLKLHNESKKHKQCRDASLAAEQAQDTGISPARNLFRGAESKLRQDVEIKMATAYYIAKEELPFTKFNSLLALQRRNGLELSKTYSSDVMCAEMVSTISDVMSDELKFELQKTNFLCVMIDGATDTSVRENEAVVVRYLSEKGELKTKLVGLKELEHAHADGMTIDDFFYDNCKNTLHAQIFLIINLNICYIRECISEITGVFETKDSFF
jgi:hypothetical protein